ncbi:MAG: HAD-IA family hydrolase, partial [Desulfobacterales bacterium]
MQNKRAFRVKAVLFDFDGTLTQPGAIDWVTLKTEIGCPIDRPVLEYLEHLDDAEKIRKAWAVLDAHEAEATAASGPNPGAAALVRQLRSQGLAVGIITRNSLNAVQRGLRNFADLSTADFNLIISRNTPVKHKPAPDGILYAARKLNVSPGEIMVVGDYLFDLQAGQRAGSVSVLLDEGHFPEAAEWVYDYRVERLEDVREILRLGRPLPAGKFPADLLKAYLEEFAFEDPSVIINPGIGEDTAAVDVAGEEVLVLKSDPITFATDAIGHYAVLINANDIATAGARPRWFLATLLFPVGSTPSDVWRLMGDLRDTCRRWQITLCGGHTEISDAVRRPVVAGMMAGTVARDKLIDKRDIRGGDRVLFTKAVAVEGTSIIAREFADRLLNLGVSEAEIETCQGFLEQVSILDEARLAAAVEGTVAMHDVTEGGLATA